MKRILYAAIALLLLLAGVPVAEAETVYLPHFMMTAYAFPYGATAKIYAEVPNGGDVYVLKTEQNIELGRTTARGGGRMLEFEFYVDRILPQHTLLQLFRAEEPEVLSETHLFCDDAQNDGIRRVARTDRKIAITFDAASSDSSTLQIMDLLEQYDARATFFVIGRFAETHAELCKQMIARGHELASHSYEHLEMAEASAAQAYASLLHADQAIRAVNGDKTILYRPPSGISTFRDRAIAHALGSEIILWEVDSGDGFKSLTLQDVIYRTQKNLNNGGISLMHVYGSTTLNALKVLLPYYTEQGYRLVTVSELLYGQDSFIDKAGTQRPLLHNSAFFSDAFTDQLAMAPSSEANRIGEEAQQEPIRGAGDATLTNLTYRDGLYRVHIQHAGERFFSVWETDANGRRVLLVSAIGDYNGTVLLYGQSPCDLLIDSQGRWSIEIEPLNTSALDSFSGTGDTVTDLAPLLAGQYRFTHDGQSNFVVWMYTIDGETALINHLGVCDEQLLLTIPDGSNIFFSVLADGNWEIARVFERNG